MATREAGVRLRGNDLNREIEVSGGNPIADPRDRTVAGGIVDYHDTRVRLPGGDKLFDH